MAAGAFLGVDHSVMGRRWAGPTEAQSRHAAHLIQSAGLAPPLAAILARFGVAPEDAEQFLAPKLRDLLPDPFSLRDMSTAAKRVLRAIARQERIVIFADYDVDGACSAALLIWWLRALGVEAAHYVPDRITEGYGPSVAAMAELAQAYDLIICVDCGTVAHEPTAAAKGADVLVIDHHLAEEQLPPAFAVVNPNRLDESGDLGHLCAAGVVFLLLVALNNLQRKAGGVTPDLLSLLDLVALATIADVAPLKGVNRAFVRQGLVVMSGRKRPGLVALCDIAQMDRSPEVYHLGFIIGPAINAGGRIGTSDLGLRLLASPDPHEAEALAERLHLLNKERREIEARVQLEAEEQLTERATDTALNWAASENWHPGVVGIVASRLKEKYNRPAFVIGFDGKTGSGSGRSIPGIDIGSAVTALRREGLVLKGGGHKMAAGLSLTQEQLQPAMAALEAALEAQGAGNVGMADLRLDAVLNASAATVTLCETLATAGPFGPGASTPRFALPEHRIAFHRVVGGKHLQLRLEDQNGGQIKAICFNAIGTPLGDALTTHHGQLFHFAGKLSIDHWRGRQEPSIQIEDVAKLF